MTPYGIIFYLLAALILGAALLAVLRRNPMHAVLFLVVSLLATAALFLLLGAPLPAVLEVVVYAGAIMVLFLFIIMLLGLSSGGGTIPAARLARPGLFGAIALGAAAWVFHLDAGVKSLLPAAQASPAALGAHLMEAWWPAVEAISILLFAALVGALALGRSAPASRQGGGS